MIITLSIMPSFTYPSPSLTNHRAITVLYHLQLFVCPVNDSVTCVPCLTGFGDGGISDVSSHHLEASDAVMTRIVIPPHLEGPSLDRPRPQPR
jgi:hypothetical protein